MKIAEALKKIHTLKGRLRRVWELAEENSYYINGRSTPEFDLQELMSEASSLTAELRDLKIKLQQRNQQIMVGGETLASAIVRLGDLRSETALREKLLKAKPRSRKDRFWEDESVVVYTSVVPEKEQRQAIEELSAQIDRLDTKIQKVNWTEDVAG